jgi:hypothetical protein
MVTVPDITDTLVTKTSIDTLSNKTLVGGSNGNSISADSIRNVAVSANSPVIGNVLIATGSGSAQWSTIPAGGSTPHYIFGSSASTVNSTSLTNVTGANGGVIMYPGSLDLPIIRFSAVAINTSPGATSQIILWDVTNNVTIATISVPSNTTVRTSLSTTTFSNVPTGAALLEVQLARTGGTQSVGIDGWYIRGGQ